MHYIMEVMDIMNEDIFMGTKQASELWKETQEKIAAWCRNGNIVPQPTQDKPGSPWRIRKDAKVKLYGKLYTPPIKRGKSI